MQSKTVSAYETFERIFSPGNDPVSIALNLSWRKRFTRLERMEKRTFGDFTAFIYKGTAGQKEKGFILSCEMFNSIDKKYAVGLISFSYDGYILHDDQFDYIISRIKKKK